MQTFAGYNDRMSRPYERARTRLLAVGAVTFGTLALAVASAAIGSAADIDAMVGIGYLSIAAAVALGLPATILLCIDYARVPKPKGQSPKLDGLVRVSMRGIGAVAIVCGSALLVWHVVTVVAPMPTDRSMLRRTASIATGVVVVAVGLKWFLRPPNGRKGPD